MNSVYDAYRPATGDIYSRYIIASDENYNAVDELINQTIEIITSAVKTDLQTDVQNSSLSNWSILYGTFNDQGLRAHPPITVRVRKPPGGLFMNMRF